MSKKISIFRLVILIFLGLAALMNLAGGIGTSCVAFNLESYPPFSGIAGYELLYQFIVIATTIIALVGFWAIVQMARGKKNSYRNALIILIIGTVLGGIHMGASLSLLGKAVPANVKFYINLATLIILLSLNLPGLQKHKQYFENGQSNDKSSGIGVTTIIAGLVVLTMPLWAGPSHTFQGNNLVYVLGTEIKISGMLLVLTGIGLLSGKLLPGWQSNKFDRIFSGSKLENKDAS